MPNIKSEKEGQNGHFKVDFKRLKAKIANSASSPTFEKPKNVILREEPVANEIRGF